jgi:hypothetical protein
MNKIGDRVVRKSKPAEEGTVVVAQYAVGPAEYIKVRWDATRSTSTIRADRVKLAPPSEIKTYPDLESAQAAMDRGETVRVEMESYPFRPELLQLALDLQAIERLAEWRRYQETTGESK